MSRVEGVGRGVLYVAIGTRCVEWGLLVGKRWVEAAGGALRIEPVGDAGAPGGVPTGAQLGALVAALERMEAALGSWWGGEPAGGRQIRIVIADSWLSVGGLPWSAALQQASSAHGFVRAQLSAAGYTVEADDVIRLDDAPFGHPLLVVAYPALLLAALAAPARRMGAQLCSVLPFSVAAWSVRSAGQGTPGALAVVDADLMLVVQGARRPTAVTVRPRAGGDVDGDGQFACAVREQWQRMRLRDPQLAGVRKLQVLSLMPGWCMQGDGEEGIVGLPLVPMRGSEAVSPRLQLAHRAHRAHRARPSTLDAVPVRGSAGTLSWLAAIAALLLTAVVSLQAWQTGIQAAARVAQLEAARTPVRSPPLPTWSREELARADAVNAAVRQLNLPISALLQALQPPRDIRAAVLAVEVAGAATDGFSAVKIVAEARTGAEMARYVGYVSERRPFVGAYLMRHEVAESEPEQPYRFTLEATWRD